MFPSLEKQPGRYSSLSDSLPGAVLLFSGRGGSQSGKHIEHSAGATRPGTNSGASVGGARARRSCTATAHARASACCAAGHARATLRSVPQVWVAQPGEPYLLWQQPVPGHAVFGQSFLLELRHPDPGQCQILPCLRA